VLTQDQMQVIQATFPPEALSADTSRGFELTSIKAAFVIERLNQVFGPCGIGWRYVHAPFEEAHTDNGRTEIVTEVAFQYRFAATNDRVGCDRIVWNAQAQQDTPTMPPATGFYPGPIVYERLNLRSASVAARSTSIAPNMPRTVATASVQSKERSGRNACETSYASAPAPTPIMAQYFTCRNRATRPATVATSIPKPKMKRRLGAQSATRKWETPSW
jgi:hypothetical protein